MNLPCMIYNYLHPPQGYWVSQHCRGSQIFMLPRVKVAPQGFGGTTTTIQLFRATNTLFATNALLVVITLATPYTFDYEISLMMITINGQGLLFSITLAPSGGVWNQ